MRVRYAGILINGVEFNFSRRNGYALLRIMVKSDTLLRIWGYERSTRSNEKISHFFGQRFM